MKDGMVVEYSNGKRRLVLNNHLIGKDGYYELNRYMEDMKDKESSERDIMRVFKIAIITTLDRIFHIENLDLIWERKEPKRTTAEEMRKKLEELTGEKIEIEPTREEMIGKLGLYCAETVCAKCVLSEMSSGCNYCKFDSEKLKQYYEKVMEDGRKPKQIKEWWDKQGFSMKAEIINSDETFFKELSFVGITRTKLPAQICVDDRAYRYTGQTVKEFLLDFTEVE